MCQRPIKPGDLSSRHKDVMPRTFMDFGSMTESDYICGFCRATSVQTVMRSLQRACITAKGVYNLNLDANRAWLILTPPEPPFSVVINNAKSPTSTFHYHWRTPVTLDSDMMLWNVDDTIYTIRRKRVLQAIEYAKQICAKVDGLGKKNAVMNSPFVMIQRDPTGSFAPRNGHLSMDALKLVELNPELATAADFLKSLTPGELLALAPILKGKPVDPIAPDLMTEVKVKEAKETEAETI